MQSVGFKINAVENGWFEAEFRTCSKRIAVSASDKWGNDAPKHLVKLVNQLVSGKINSGYVTFDETPGTYILFIDNSSDTSLLYIFYSTKETCHCKDFHTYGEMTLSDLLKKIEIKELLLFAEVDLEYLTDNLYREFDLYTDPRHLSIYEENWNSFPSKEFNKLEALIRPENYSHIKFVTA